jgi:hypothetical protein
MQFSYSDEQAMLLESVERFGAQHFPPGERHRLIREGRSGEEAAWAQWPSLAGCCFPSPRTLAGLAAGLSS